MADYVLSTATKAWSVYNIFRSTGLTSSAAIAAYWEDQWDGIVSTTTEDFAGWTSTGISALVSDGFITYPSSVVTAVELDSFNKPKRLRRTEADPDVLEFLPDGEQPESI